jgi:hypothetical protein
MLVPFSFCSFCRYQLLAKIVMTHSGCHNVHDYPLSLKPLSVFWFIKNVNYTEQPWQTRPKSNKFRTICESISYHYSATLRPECPQLVQHGFGLINGFLSAIAHKQGFLIVSNPAPHVRAKLMKYSTDANEGGRQHDPWGTLAYMENGLQWIDTDGGSIVETIFAKSAGVFVLVAIPSGFVAPIDISLSQQKRSNVETCTLESLHLLNPTHSHAMQLEEKNCTEPLATERRYSLIEACAMFKRMEIPDARMVRDILYSPFKISSI